MTVRRTEAHTDRIITWLISALATISFSVGAFMFRDLVSEVRTLRSELTTVGCRVAIVDALQVAPRLNDLDQRLTRLEASLGRK